MTHPAQIAGKRIAGLNLVRGADRQAFLASMKWDQHRYNEVCKDLSGTLSDDECRKAAVFFMLPPETIMGTCGINGNPNSSDEFFIPAFLTVGDRKAADKLHAAIGSLTGKPDLWEVVKWVTVAASTMSNDRARDIFSGKSRMTLAWFDLILRKLQDLADTNQAVPPKASDILGENWPEIEGYVRGTKTATFSTAASNGHDSQSSSAAPAGQPTPAKASREGLGVDISTKSVRMIIGGNIVAIIRANQGDKSMAACLKPLAEKLGVQATPLAGNLTGGNVAIDEGRFAKIKGHFGVPDSAWWVVKHTQAEINSAPASAAADDDVIDLSDPKLCGIVGINLESLMTARRETMNRGEQIRILARELGVEISDVAKIREGTFDELSDDMIDAICEIYEVEREWLLVDHSTNEAQEKPAAVPAAEGTTNNNGAGDLYITDPEMLLTIGKNLENLMLQSTVSIGEQNTRIVGMLELSNQEDVWKIRRGEYSTLMQPMLEDLSAIYERSVEWFTTADHADNEDGEEVDHAAEAAVLAAADSDQDQATEEGDVGPAHVEQEERGVEEEITSAAGVVAETEIVEVAPTPVDETPPVEAVVEIAAEVPLPAAHVELPEPVVPAAVASEAAAEIESQPAAAVEIPVVAEVPKMTAAELVAIIAEKPALATGMSDLRSQITALSPEALEAVHAAVSLLLSAEGLWEKMRSFALLLEGYEPDQKSRLAHAVIDSLGS